MEGAGEGSEEWVTRYSGQQKLGTIPKCSEFLLVENCGVPFTRLCVLLRRYTMLQMNTGRVFLHSHIAVWKEHRESHP